VLDAAPCHCDTHCVWGRKLGGLCVGLLVVGLSGTTAEARNFAPGCSGIQGNVGALVNDMALANTIGGSNTINLSVGCIYDLTTVNNSWYGPNGLPPVANRLTIEGHGATIARDAGAPSFRLFYVGADPSKPNTQDYTSPGAGDLTLDEVTLGHGLAQGGDSNGGGGGAGMGGAIFNQGVLRVTRSTLTANEAHGGSSIDATAGTGGGGIGSSSVGKVGGGFGSGSFGGAAGGAGQHDGGGGGGAGFAVSETGGNATNSPYSVGGAGGGPATGTAGLGGAWTGTAGLAGDGGGGGGATFGIDSGSGGSFGAGGGAEGGGGGVGGGGGGGTESGGGGGFGGGGGMGNTGSGSGKGGAGGFGGGGGGGGTGSSAVPGASGFGGGYGSGANGGGGAGMGGAIFNMQGIVTIANSTITGNRAIGGADHTPDHGKGIAGAVFNLSGLVNITSSTVAENSASTSASEIYNLVYDAHQARTAQVSLRGTILSGGTGPYELASDKTSYIIPTPNLGTAAVDVSQHDLVRSMNAEEATSISGSPLTIDPLLGPLQDNGGPTQTMALKTGSPAIDAGGSFGAPTDQRGNRRPIDFPGLANRPGGDGSDIGAFEVQRRCDLQRTPAEPCHTLSITRFGNGAGTITAPGLSCSAACAHPYAASATVTLSARAARGSVFAGWGGACEGKLRCTVSLSTNRAVSARFHKLLPLTITRLTQLHNRWRVGSERAHLAHNSNRTPTGTTFTFALNRAAHVTMVFRSGGKTQGTLHFKAPKGRDTVFFAGRLSNTRRLHPGRYTLALSAVDAAGLHARSPSLRFSIIK
jgi:hypothetical protein